MNDLSEKTYFDDTVNIKAKLSDISRQLVYEYLKCINSPLLNENIEYKELLKRLKVVDKDYRPLNIGLLMFNLSPDKFFPSCFIKIILGNGKVERIFTGQLDWQLSCTLNYVENMAIAEKIFKIPDQAETIRIKSYIFCTIKVFIINTFYHKDYKSNVPIIIKIDEDKISISNPIGNNKRVGNFLKELDFVKEEKNGIANVLKVIEKNNYPLPTFTIDQDADIFVVEIPIHPVFIND